MIADFAAYLVAFLTGGGLWKLWDYLLKSRKQRHHINLDDMQAARQLRDELRADLEVMRGRLDRLETALELEREARIKAELSSQVLQRKVDLLIRMLNDLRAKEGMEPLSEEDILPVE